MKLPFVAAAMQSNPLFCFAEPFFHQERCVVFVCSSARMRVFDVVLNFARTSFTTWTAWYLTLFDFALNVDRFSGDKDHHQSKEHAATECAEHYFLDVILARQVGGSKFRSCSLPVLSTGPVHIFETWRVMLSIAALQVVFNGSAIGKVQIIFVIDGLVQKTPSLQFIAMFVQELQMMALNIGVGAGKFLGVRRIFARISPNLPEKLLCDFFPKNFLSQKWLRPLKLLFGWPRKKIFVCFFGFRRKKAKRWAPICPDFRQIKTFGGALAPPLLSPLAPEH